MPGAPLDPVRLINIESGLPDFAPGYPILEPIAWVNYLD